MITIDTFKTRDEWLKHRKNGLGGSDIAAVIGANPFMSNIDLWEIKTGRRQQADISENPRVKYGTEAESPLRELFALDHPEYIVAYEEFNSVHNDKYPWALASLDGATYEIERERDGILEIKTTEIMSSMDWQKWDEKIPQNYFCQVLFYMGVTERAFADLRAGIRYTSANGERRMMIRDYHIERSEVADDIAYIMSEGAKFWYNVEHDIRPALILPEI